MHASTPAVVRNSFPAILPSRAAIGLALAVALCAAAAAGALRLVASPSPTPVPEGRYAGTLTAAFEGRDGECAQLSTLPELIVAGERAMLAGGTAMLRGRLHEGGNATLTGALAGPATLTGRFEGARFTGELRGWNCTYTLALTHTPT